MEQAATSSREEGPPAIGAWMIGDDSPIVSDSGVVSFIGRSRSCRRSSRLVGKIRYAT